MKPLLILTSLPLLPVSALSLNTYDLALTGLYPRHHYHTTTLQPPLTRTTKSSPKCDPAHLFFTPRGPLVTGDARGPVIVDKDNELVWMENEEWAQAMNFQVQRYKGEEYLTFWTKHKKGGKDKAWHKKEKGKEGKKKDKKKKQKEKEPQDDEEVEEQEDIEGIDEDDEEVEDDIEEVDVDGDGLDALKKKKHKKPKKPKKSKKAKIPKKSYVMLNSSYEVAHRITPVGKGLKADSHEFRITPEGTALVIIYYKHQADCSELNLGKECWIQDGIFQEIEIETGKLLFEWRATDHISMKTVYSSPNRKDGYGTSKKDAFDYFHINSVDKTEAGDYVVSARYMHAILCISGKDGSTLWTLGGKHSDFTTPKHDGALDFAWQHHVSWQGNNTLSLFDNHANNVFHWPSSHSKGMIIHLDFDTMTATLVHKYPHPNKILNVSQGSVQILPDSGNVLVGFGNSPTFVEYAEDGDVLCVNHFAPEVLFEVVDFGFVKSYRVFKHHWVGKPKTRPDVVVVEGGDRGWVSWNGATEVERWSVEVAGSVDAMDSEFEVRRVVEKKGFETSFKLGRKDKFVRVKAVGKGDKVLAVSAVVGRTKMASISPWSILLVIIFSVLTTSILLFVFVKGRLPRVHHLRRSVASLRVPTSIKGLKHSWNVLVVGMGRRKSFDEEDEEEGLLLLDDRVGGEERERRGREGRETDPLLGGEVDS